MPLFLYFGLDAKVKETKVKQNKICTKCERYLTFSIFKVMNYFHFFGIKLFSWNNKFIAVCPQCGDTYKIPNEEFEKAKDDIFYKIPPEFWTK